MTSRSKLKGDAAEWADPDCNVKAMLHLYREAGTSPWSL